MLGGGTFETMDKKLPGTYINFISLPQVESRNYDRGIAAIGMSFDWGPEDLFKVDSADLLTESKKLFGYDYTADEMLPVRELFKHAKTVYFYRLNGGGVKASATGFTATCSGTRGNKISVKIEASVDVTGAYIVKTLLDGEVVDKQTVTAASGLVDNDFVKFSASSVTLTAGTTALTGGTNGTVTGEKHSAFLAALENKTFHVLGCNSAESTVKAVYVAYTERMRDERGLKFQTVIYDGNADYEGVINMDSNAGVTIDALPWVVGAEAGCSLSGSLTNMEYDGELELAPAYTQAQLEDALDAGKFVFHIVGEDSVRVLQDVNSLVSYTVKKSKVFALNDVIRTIDMLATQEAAIFNERYIGLKNTADNRGALWSDIVKIHNDLQDMQALENFTSDDITIAQGVDKGDVVVTSVITVTSAMIKLYITTYIG